MREAVEQNQEAMNGDQSCHFSPVALQSTFLKGEAQVAHLQPPQLVMLSFEMLAASPFRVAPFRVGLASSMWGEKKVGGQRQSGLLGPTQQFLLFSQLVFFLLLLNS